MVKEFRDFIMKGDVMSLAVAVIIGAAFGAIVASLVADILTPLLGMLMGGVDLTALTVNVGDAVLGYGNFLQAIINFVMISFVLFLLIKQYNKVNPPEEPAPAEDPADVVLLKEIRDLLAR